MKLTSRDCEILAKLKANNRTLRESDILRLALDQLAEKQGLLPAQNRSTVLPAVS